MRDLSPGLRLDQGAALFVFFAETQREFHFRIDRTQRQPRFGDIAEQQRLEQRLRCINRAGSLT